MSLKIGVKNLSGHMSTRIRVSISFMIPSEIEIWIKKIKDILEMKLKIVNKMVTNIAFRLGFIATGGSMLWNNITSYKFK